MPRPARIGRRGGWAIVRAARSVLRGRRNFFQQCGLSGNVRPRDDWAGRDAGLSGPARAWRIQRRNSRWKSARAAARIRGIHVEVPGYGDVAGDVAWGGNWFFLVGEHSMEISLQNAEKLTEFAWRIRQELARAGVTGPPGEEIDHIELFAPSRLPGVNSKNFVLCPGKSYDRSPCGTGTCAKMACLHAGGKLQEGEIWRQESIVGSVFEGSIQVRDGVVHPSIKGSAYITAESELILDESDPFRCGFTK